MTPGGTIATPLYALAQIWASWMGWESPQPWQVMFQWPQAPYTVDEPITNLLPSNGNALWYREPASNITTWSTEWLPIGNGFLGAMVSGGTADDVIQLNLESFWSGGPFVNESYNGGNRPPIETFQLTSELNSIREQIFRSHNGEAETLAPLTYPPLNYGSYSGAGHLLISKSGDTAPSAYLRWLDLESGLLKTVWREGNVRFEREYFCSYPTKSCTAYIKTSSLRGTSLAFSFTPLPELKNVNTTCLDASTLKYRGQTEDTGMTFEFLAKVQTVPRNKVQCRTIHRGVVAELVAANVTEAWITWSGDTNYNINAGDASHDYSFRGADPHYPVLSSLRTASDLTYPESVKLHTSDYTKTTNSRFRLDFGAKPDFTKSTRDQVREYRKELGNPHLEWLLFNYGRYMLATSARGVLPSNLQGVWAKEILPPWSADYHANINTQMNYWAAEMTDMDVTQSLWDYMAKTWIPRGQETAAILYNTSRGWVTHNEMNIFGHTGMKSWGPWNSAQWANYPASGAWMMTQVIDHMDYGLGTPEWWREQGWPLVKGTAEFWLDNLFVDSHTDDGTMVACPCNSPEQTPITFGCAHFQQLIWELFNGVEKWFDLAEDDDVPFLAEVRAKKARLDRGLHVGSWGQLQEWKVDKDRQNDLHRHLSHLVGLYPSYSIASYPEGGAVMGLSRKKLLEAARTSLNARGDGTGPDADAGWEKVWRAACWAQLEDGERFYSVLKYAVLQNFGYNLFSLYDPHSFDPIFQIDANLGYPAVVMNALLQAPDTSSLDSPLKIHILPALPKAWSASGSVKGARVRGGVGISFDWKAGRATGILLTFDRMPIPSRDVEVWVAGEFADGFEGIPGLVRRISV